MIETSLIGDIKKNLFNVGAHCSLLSIPLQYISILEVFDKSDHNIYIKFYQKLESSTHSNEMNDGYNKSILYVCHSF